MAFELEIALAVVSLVLLALYLNARSRIESVQAQLASVVSQKQSMATRHGKTAEQFFPFLEDYPYNRKNFRFLGTPIDGVQFEDDRIILVEFKTGGKLSERQRRIRDLVKNGDVEFEEFRI